MRNVTGERTKHGLQGSGDYYWVNLVLLFFLACIYIILEIDLTSAYSTILSYSIIIEIIISWDIIYWGFLSLKVFSPMIWDTHVAPRIRNNIIKGIKKNKKSECAIFLTFRIGHWDEWGKSWNMWGNNHSHHWRGWIKLTMDDVMLGWGHFTLVPQGRQVKEQPKVTFRGLQVEDWPYWHPKDHLTTCWESLPAAGLRDCDSAHPVPKGPLSISRLSFCRILSDCFSIASYGYHPTSTPLNSPVDTPKLNDLPKGIWPVSLLLGFTPNVQLDFKLSLIQGMEC